MSQVTPSHAGFSGSLVIEQLNDLVYVVDPQHHVLYANETACRILGYAREELLAAGAAAIGVGDPPGSAWGVGDRYTTETSLQSRDGRVIPVEISARVIEHAGGPVKVIVARDIGERKCRELTLLTLVDNLPDVVVRYDLQLRRTYVNPAFHVVHGTTDEEVLGKLPGEGSRLTEPGAIALQGLLRQTFATRVPCDHEFSLPARDGRIFYWHLRVIPEFDENKAVTSLLTVWSEVTDRKHLLASLDRLAYHDALTGVANRALLVERLTTGLRAAAERPDALALLFIDLDWFKIVNDRWGHEAGDAVLVATAQRLQSVVREADTVARFGGDEFVIVLGERCCTATLATLMEKVSSAIAEPVLWKGTVLRIGASVGLARYPEDGLDAHALLQRADESMYSEKARRQSKAGRYG
jgi:diguanylate cyclase (GGDEF)-like protein/PAS domain S-box-containing protein